MKLPYLELGFKDNNTILVLSLNDNKEAALSEAARLARKEGCQQFQVFAFDDMLGPSLLNWFQHLGMSHDEAVACLRQFSDVTRQELFDAAAACGER